jgi:branched-chain amino acid aminotransferase
MEKAANIWFNGQLIPWDDARVHVLSHVMHYGSGVFEGMRAYSTPQGPAVVGLQLHVRRLFRSCKVLYMDLPWAPEQVETAIVDTVRANGHNACYIRPLAFRGYGELGVLPDGNPIDLIVASFPWGAYHGSAGLEEGVDVGVSSWRRMAPDTHPAMVKASGNYVNSMLVVMEARRHGYAEGVVLDTDGYVAEGSGENIFLVVEGELLTPSIGSSILDGITRGYVKQLAGDLKIPVREMRIPREMLYFADEIFMTGTAAEITPVRTVDHRVVGTGRPGDVTRQLQSEFFAILNGKAPDRHNWLTHISVPATQ